MAGGFEHTGLRADTTASGGTTDAVTAPAASAPTGSRQADSTRNRVAAEAVAAQGHTAGSESSAAEGSVMAADSLAGSDSAARADTFGPAGLIGHYDSADSMQWFEATIGEVPAPDAATPWPIQWRDTTARAVFGDASTLAQPRGPEQTPPAEPTDNVPFQCFVLLLAVTYAVLLYRNLDDIVSLLSRIFHDTTSRKRLSEDTGGSGFSRFLRLTNVIGMLFLGLLAVKFGGQMVATSSGGFLARSAMLLLSLATSVAGGIIVLYQRIVLHSAGAITVTQPFIAQLFQLKRTYFALAVVTSVPTLLLYVLSAAGSGAIWLYILLFESALTAILYIKESLSLFLSKNFSILHWFLYLCSVELFPVSLIWLLITRENVSI